MSNVFKDLQRGITGELSFLILILWPVSLLGTLTTGRLMYEDHLTTVASYNQIPTFEVSDGVIGGYVAVTLLAAQLVIGYMFLSDTSRQWAKPTLILLTIADVFTDSWFRMGGQWNLELLPWALFLSLIVFTIGSDVMFTILGGFCLQSAASFFKTLFVMLNSLIDVALDLFHIGGVSDNNVRSSKPPGLRDR